MSNTSVNFEIRLFCIGSYIIIYFPDFIIKSQPSKLVFWKKFPILLWVYKNKFSKTNSGNRKVSEFLEYSIDLTYE